MWESVALLDGTMTWWIPLGLCFHITIHQSLRLFPQDLFADCSVACHWCRWKQAPLMCQLH